MSRERFIELVTTDQPDTPAYFTYDAVLNARGRPTLDEALDRGLRPLSLAELRALVADGAELLDTREPAEFEAAHIRGALNIGLGGSFATWCGTILDTERPVVLIAEPGRELEAATRLGRIGFDAVAGCLAGAACADRRYRSVGVGTAGDGSRVSAASRADRILERVRAIPEGFVSTYGDIDPRAPRLVGQVLAGHPGAAGDTLPWHRVVRADGTLTQGAAQRERLRREGVPMRGERVDLRQARLPREGGGTQG